MGEKWELHGTYYGLTWEVLRTMSVPVPVVPIIFFDFSFLLFYIIFIYIMLLYMIICQLFM